MNKSKKEVRQWVADNFYEIAKAVMELGLTPGSSWATKERGYTHEEVVSANEAFAEIVGEQIAILMKDALNAGVGSEFWYPNNPVYVNVLRENFGQTKITVSVKPCDDDVASIPFDTIIGALSFISKEFGSNEKYHTPLNAKEEEKETASVA